MKHGFKINEARGLEILQHNKPFVVNSLIKLIRKGFEIEDWTLAHNAIATYMKYSYPTIAAVTVRPDNQEAMKILEEIRRAHAIAEPGHDAKVKALPPGNGDGGDNGDNGHDEDIVIQPYNYVEHGFTCNPDGSITDEAWNAENCYDSQHE